MDALKRPLNRTRSALRYLAGAAPIHRWRLARGCCPNCNGGLFLSFRHVPDDMRAFRECYRVLKPGGALIFSVPLYDLPATRQLARIEEDGAVTHLATPEYHDSRLAGPGSALCFWRHSLHDIVARVSDAGFDTRLVETRFPRTLADSSFVVYAVKPTAQR